MSAVGTYPRALAAVALALALAIPAAAQDQIAIDEDDLFGSEDDVVGVVEETAQGSALGSLLTTESVRVGGRLSGSVSPYWTWNDPWEGNFDFTAPDAYGLDPELSALVFFDARPTEDSRFYGSVKTAWPFATQAKVLTQASYVPAIPPATSPSVATTPATLSLPDAEVFELFSDFSWGDSLYFRFGKQTVNWGVGYFYSPANILNLQEIDPNDPEAQLEGPVALRAQYTVPGTQHNLWAYSVFDSTTMKPEDTAMAAKAEFVLGGWELGAGAYYKYDAPIRGMLTAVGSLGKVGLFGEATISRGSGKTWVTEVSPALAATKFIATKTDDASVFLKGSAGLSYSNSDAKVSVMGQYLYDGEGYADADRKARIAEAKDSETAIKAMIAALDPAADVDAAFSQFLKGLIVKSGRHYAAATFSKNELLLDDLSFALLALGNLSDFSAILRPSLSYRFFDGMSATASASFSVGYDDGEYVVLNDGRAMSLSLSVTLGSGSF